MAALETWQSPWQQRLTPSAKKGDPRSKEWGQKHLERFNTGKLNQGERYHCLEPNTVVETMKQLIDMMERNAAKDMKQKCEKFPRVKERISFSFLIGFYLLDFYLPCNANRVSISQGRDRWCTHTPHRTLAEVLGEGMDFLWYTGSHGDHQPLHLQLLCSSPAVAQGSWALIPT